MALLRTSHLLIFTPFTKYDIYTFLIENRSDADSREEKSMGLGLEVASRKLVCEFNLGLDLHRNAKWKLSHPYR
jgi:hypothetical protein